MMDLTKFEVGFEVSNEKVDIICEGDTWGEWDRI